MINKRFRQFVSAITFLLAFSSLIYANIVQAQFIPSGLLEIHYINVGQGGATLIIGPNGTRILYDFGWKDDKTIASYLRDIVHLSPEDGLDYTIVSHNDADHYTGFRQVIGKEKELGNYRVHKINFDSGSPRRSRRMDKYWRTPAAATKAGAVQPIPVGLVLPLGDGAELIVMAANGKVYGGIHVNIRDENDRSVAIFINYGKFQYLLDGDLGAGREACTKHDTYQRDVQTYVANALIKYNMIQKEYGVDVLHIAHHGSESSTSAAYYNIMKPEVGLINVGLNQRKFLHPREDVVDSVLLGSNRPECVKAPPVKYVFQTEDGLHGSSSTGKTSFNGLSIGNIRLTTDGSSGYTISGDNQVSPGSDAEAKKNGGPKWSFDFDEN